ncbi:hypothetical protein TanjilG_13262 [Lupinus angustifolius]|uniref:C2H2-type domain-containing protein n=1 Tax=Lupinus angustifolius TaxID=3871 RepID=A0A4P1RTY2_LUPAN|nr:PREDICTED: uncharacterized protein LOC109353684 [Lupinus angustifolius]OIW18510.1 hypothetical protein TanjilG_13262 [Lupinus angustifolius]
MEEDQESVKQQYMCKFCSKCFPCGRSLGGHVRAHITNLSSSADTEDKEKEKVVGSEAGTTINTGYGLRENPKKTWRIADSTSEDTLLTLTTEKFCRECGKGFQSWKALFGHMKCHTDKERVSNNNNNSLVEDQDSVTNNNASSSHNQKLISDSQSDNEATAPSRRRRSKRRRTRYIVGSANPSFSSPVSEAEQEQEDVAMSLIMLSRDLSPWSGFNSVADHFSDYNSAYFKPSSSVQTGIEKMKKPVLNCSYEIATMIKQSEKKLEFGNSASGNLNSKGKNSEPLAAEFIKNEKGKKCELDYVSALEDSEVELGKDRVNGSESVLSKSTITNKYNSIKTDFFCSELKSKSLQNWAEKASEAAEFSNNTHKRGKFECATCNKIFHSYQALGGHRASHKRSKSCFVTRKESSENSIENELSPDPITESKFMKNIDNEYLVEPEVNAAGYDNEVADTVTESKKSKVHECPICFKVFQSGQALGGHKRSHLAIGSESTKNFQKVVVEEPVQEIREFLDLNLPAATEEGSTSYIDSHRTCWLVENNHKQEAPIGVMTS